MNLDFENCTGILSYAGDSIEIGYSLEIKNDGEFSFELDPIDFVSSYRWIYDRYRIEDYYVNYFNFVSDSDEGYVLSTDSFFITELKTNDGKTYIKGRSDTTNVRMSEKAFDENEISTITIQYKVPGYKQFARIRTSLDENIYMMSSAGNFSINYPAKDNPEYDFDDIIYQLNLFMSISSGKKLNVVRKSTFLDGKWTESIFRKIKSSAHVAAPSFFYMNLEPTIKCVMQSILADKIKPKGIDVALSWMIAPSNYRETNFICMMTALEHLVQKYYEDTSGRIVTASKFKKRFLPHLKSEIERIVSDEPYEEQESERIIKAMTNKLLEINRLSFSDKLMRMLSTERVYIDDFSDEIKDIVRTRNQIIHNGFKGKTEPEDLERRESVVLNELLIRIILTFIDFDDQYQSYLNPSPSYGKLPTANDRALDA